MSMVVSTIRIMDNLSTCAGERFKCPWIRGGGKIVDGSSSVGCKSGIKAGTARMSDVTDEVVSGMYAGGAHTSGLAVLVGSPAAVSHFKFTGVGGDPMSTCEKGLARTRMSE